MKNELFCVSTEVLCGLQALGRRAWAAAPRPCPACTPTTRPTPAACASCGATSRHTAASLAPLAAPTGGTEPWQWCSSVTCPAARPPPPHSAPCTTNWKTSPLPLWLRSTLWFVPQNCRMLCLTLSSFVLRIVLYGAGGLQHLPPPDRPRPHLCLQTVVPAPALHHWDTVPGRLAGSSYQHIVPY